MLTAIDILFEKIDEIPFQSPDAGALYDDIIKLYKDAKELEKQQIIHAYSVGYITDFKLNSDYTTQTPEQYYNETFKTC